MPLLTVEVFDAHRVERTLATNDAVIATLEAQANGGALTQSIVTMSGASDVLVEADDDRTSVTVVNGYDNDLAVIGITGEVAALDEGWPLPPGGGVKISGTAAQSAMTQIGTSGEKLTVYVE